MQKYIELLAPAGGLEQLKAAVYNGADAIYFGGEKFSARAKAANFGREELIKARRITSRYGVKLYCAINTMLFDNELQEALEYIGELALIGIDALIIQDIGLMDLVRSRYPEMEIHSSTQMSIQNHHGLDFLKSRGVTRAVLPRETSLADLGLMKERGIELEVFVHGAICICFSGQCLMSSMIGARSGNRGACAQPCRLQYSLMDLASGKQLTEDSSALLSPKDMMLINSIDKLIDAGVTSFKIEGRMKTPEYVATIVRYYREAIDKALAGEVIVLSPEDNKEIAQVFSRDFTDGYLRGESGKELMNPRKPNNRGVLLGRVQNYAGGKAEILLKSPLEVGDKVSVWTTKEGRVNISVDRILLDGSTVPSAAPGQLVTLDIPKRVNRDDRVFRIEAVALRRQLQEQIGAHEGDEKIALDVLVRGQVGEPLEITFQDEEGCSAVVRSEQLLEQAQKHPLEEEGFRAQMRLGDTEYSLRNIDLETGPVMVPKSILNSLRRQGTALLEEQRKDSWQLPDIRLDLPSFPKTDAELKVTVLAETPEKIRLALELGADFATIPLAGFRHAGLDAAGLEGFLKGCKEEEREKVIIELPRIVREQELAGVEESIRKVLPYAGGFRAHTLDQIWWLRELGVERIHGDSSLNVANSFSYRFFKEELGLAELELSRELNLSQLVGMPKGAQLPLFGVQELMVLEHCILGSELGKGACKRSLYGLKDRKDVIFPILVDGLGKNHILNGRVLLLTEELEALKRMGFRHFSLNFILREEGEMRRILETYLGLLRGTLPMEAGARRLLSMVSGFTKGHYNRGVL